MREAAARDARLVFVTLATRMVALAGELRWTDFVRCFVEGVEAIEIDGVVSRVSVLDGVGVFDRVPAFGRVSMFDGVESVSIVIESGLADITASARVLSSARTSLVNGLSLEQAAKARVPIVRADVRKANLI